MKRKNLKQANDLLERIEKLERMLIEFRPKHCSGVAISRTGEGTDDRNKGIKNYAYHLFASTPDSVEDEAVIMRTMIKVAHKQVDELLEDLKSQFDNIEL